MTDVARFGLVVDAAGAQREIKLTREELIKLANGGKEAESALKALNDGAVREIPRAWQPAQRNVHGLTDAIQRMRAAAMQADDARLADKMRQWEQQSQRTAQGVNAITESIKRMRAANAQAQANGMAGLIAANDPFQAVSKSAASAAPSLDRLRGPLTAIAISASGIPGPLGRVASVLGQFAFGGALTIGVMAGIAAIGLAWEKATEKSRKAREEWQKQLDLLQKIKREQDLGIPGEAGAAVRGGRARLGVLAGQIADISGRDISNARKMTAIAPLAAEYTQIALAVQAGEKDVTERVRKDADERAEIARREVEKRLALYKELADARKRLDLDIVLAALYPTITGKPVTGTNRVDLQEKLSGNQWNLKPADLTDSLNRTAVRYAAVFEKLATQEAQKGAAQQHLGQWGVNFVANRAGPFGGMVGGVGSALMAGNPFGAAAAGVTGLIDGILGMADASRQAAEGIREFRRSVESFSDSMGVQTGRLSTSEAQRRQAERDFQNERAAVQEGIRKALNEWEPDEVVRLQELLKQMDADYGEWIKAIERNTEALTTASRNAPRGFFAESYMGPYSPSGGTPHDPRNGSDPRAPGATMVPFSGTVTFNITNPDPVVAAQQVVQGLRLVGLAIAGNGSTNSDVLNLM